MPEKQKKPNRYKFRGELEAMARAQQFNRALLAEREECARNIRDILEAFNDCMAMANRDKPKYQYCFDVLGIVADGSGNRKSKNFYNRTALKELNSYAAKFIDNVFPQQKRNFVITAKDECVDQFQAFYPDVPYEEIRNRIDEFLQNVTELVHDEINGSDFFELFLDCVKISTVRQFDLLIQPDTGSYGRKSDITFIQIPPFSVAYDYNDKRDIVGIYRNVRIRVKDIAESYPDYAFHTLKDLKPRQTAELKECCFLKFIPLLNEYRWVYLFINGEDEIVLFRLLPFNPFITFCETLPIGSNVGHGKIFDCYEDIKRAEDKTVVLEKAIRTLYNPPLELLEGAITDKEILRNKEINPGDVITVRQQGTVRPVSLGQNPEAIMTLVQTYENNIRNSISGEILTVDPNATATLTTAQLAQRANFLASLQGKILTTFLFQLVQKTLFCLRETGVLQNAVKSFLQKDPKRRLPDAVFTNEVKLDPELYEATLNWFADALIRVFGDMTQLKLNILSNIGMRQKLDDVNNMTTGLQLIAQLTGMPTNAFIAEDRLISALIDGMGLKQSVFLTADEMAEKQQRMLEAQLAAQQAQQN